MCEIEMEKVLKEPFSHAKETIKAHSQCLVEQS